MRSVAESFRGNLFPLPEEEADAYEGDRHKKIPAAALEIIAVLEAAGFEAWLVGGCVRDLLRGSLADDWDIATSALPEAVQGCFPQTVPTGLRHGTVTVLRQGRFEVTTYRAEGPYTDHRRPDGVVFVTALEQDLARRDFTVNAMAWHPVRAFGTPSGAKGSGPPGTAGGGEPRHPLSGGCPADAAGRPFCGPAGF